MAKPEHGNEWMDSSLHDIACAFADLGLSVVPPAEDGTKRPIGEWKVYQSERADLRQIDQWYGMATGIGLVCGQISQGLELFEFDERATYDRFCEACRGLNGGDLLNAIEAGYLEETPGGGIHWFYFVGDGAVRGSTKLARRKVGEHEFKTLIETKGEGGFVVVAPSFGRVHPTGKAYRLIQGGLDRVVSLTDEERNWLWDLARSFDETGESQNISPEPAQPARDHTVDWPDTITPGDDFNARMKWADILVGWRLVYQHGETEYWRRPGKDHGHSATVNHGGTDRLHVFSSSTEFQPGEGYSRFGAYAQLNHHGDFSATARALYEAGYGTHKEWVEEKGEWILRIVQNPVAKGHRLAKPGDEPPHRSRIDPQINGQDGKGGEPVGNVQVIAEPPRFHLTDLGNAERLVARHGGDMVFCHPWKCWLVWDQLRWRRDDTAEPDRRAQETVRSMLAETALMEDRDERKYLTAWSFASEKRDRIAGMLHIARSLVPILPKEMDQDAWSFNCGNGTIDLHTGTLRPHRREDRITKLCPHAYDPDAECPLWLATLEKFFGGNTELISYWQRLIGYAMVGVTTEHILPIAHGGGNNGKSTILGTLLDVFGEDYSIMVADDLVMSSANEPHPTNMTDLFGKRLAIAMETKAGRLNESKIKKLTGGDMIRARGMGENYWQFRPTHTLFISTNHKPNIKDSSVGMWRRPRLVPFMVTIDEAEADRAMPEKLKGEAPGILAWVVRGVMEWLKNGLDTPLAVLTATDEYRRAEDIMGAFIERNYERNRAGQVKAGEVYNLYRSSMEKEGERPMSLTAFGKEMAERGFLTRKSSVIYYLGLSLRIDAPDSDGIF
jgi:putative DNA primase/helicase